MVPMQLVLALAEKLSYHTQTMAPRKVVYLLRLDGSFPPSKKMCNMIEFVEKMAMHS